MRESTIEKKVTAYARSKGWHSYKLNGPGDIGKPDRLYFSAGGRIKFVEFKAPGKKPRPAQIHQLELLEGLGHDVHVIDDVGAGCRLFT